MRGVNTGGVASTVAVYVDETPFGSSSGLVNGAILAGDFDTFDMQRIEVLRGPQGTLYGASSLGGVLKFVTNAPQTDSTEARVRFSAENVDGRRDGLFRHGHGERAARRIRSPSAPRLSTATQGRIHRLDRHRRLGSSQKTSTGRRASAVACAVVCAERCLHGAAERSHPEHPQRCGGDIESNPDTLETLNGGLTQSQFVPEFSDLDYRVYNATLDFDLGFGTLTSATSYNELEQPFRSDLTTQFSRCSSRCSASAPHELYQDQTTKYDKVTQELRLASPSSDTFEWLLGGYYTKEKGDIIQHIEAVTPGTLRILAGPARRCDPAFGIRRDAVSSAARPISPRRFDLTLGGRYSDNDQDATQVDGWGARGRAHEFPVAASSEDVFTYSVAPKWKLDEHKSLYVRVARASGRADRT